MEQAQHAIDVGDYEQAFRVYKHLFAFHHDAGGEVLARAARAAVSQEDTEQAFEWIAQALHRGGDEVPQALSWPGFVQLQSDPRWQPAAERLGSAE